MYIKGLTSGYAFSRSPIVLRENVPAQFVNDCTGRYYLQIATEKVYEGRFYPPLEVDISEIIDSSIDPIPDAPQSNDEPIVMVEDADDMNCRKVLCRLEYSSFESECEFTAIPGGVSGQNYRKYIALASDAFNVRFMNPAGNFFLTTRSNDWRIKIKETELYPLFFIVPSSYKQITVKELSADTTLTFDNIYSGIAVLDIDALRRRFMDQNDVLSNIFDIWIDNTYSCRIEVLRSEPAEERYRLKFRNSLGVFEIVEVVGTLSISPKFGGETESTFSRYNQVTGEFYSDREKVECSQTITVESGIKRPDEIVLLMDMIGSDEVYLLDLFSQPIKVIPSVEDFKYRSRPETPTGFTLRLDIADSEINIMQEIIDGNDHSRPRIFSKHFSKQFN